MFRRIAWILTGSLALTAATGAFAGESERILGYSQSAEGITYQVTSGGCTEKADFEVQQLETYPVQLKLVRNEPDFCEAYFPYGTKITFTWEELGLSAGTRAIMANQLSPVNAGGSAEIAPSDNAESLLGVTTNAEGITYQVASSGCTSKDNFELLQRETYPVQLVLVRTQADLCRAFFPYGTTVTYTWEELGLSAGAQAIISNPLAQLLVN